jgi:putative transposase
VEVQVLDARTDRLLDATAATVAAPIHVEDELDEPRMDHERRGTAPELIRCDNGPELVAHALKDWCRFAGVTTGYIEPGAPWQNPYIESFNGHLRRELLDMESFNTLYEAQILINGWRLEYNHYRPHQSLNYQTPAEYARRCRTEKQPELS